jgi:hypothetical protein
MLRAVQIDVQGGRERERERERKKAREKAREKAWEVSNIHRMHGTMIHMMMHRVAHLRSGRISLKKGAMSATRRDTAMPRAI